MDAFEFEEKPIQLVYVTSEGKYQLNPAAESFLRKIPKPLSIVSVAGLYRTGKSYLLNRILLNRNNGFGVGPTINPCTKGLWCWGVPLKGTTADGEKINILIVDSQGIGALDEDQNHDIKIFTLAILTSSIFIYNSVGSIDQTALQNLSLVVNLTKNIQLNTSNNDEDDPQELARYFPTFFWVVRDFSLQLISSQGETLTPKDYLQRALAPQKGFSDDVEEKNRIRRLLTAFFKDRQCATLVRPLVNEQKLQHLYQCSFEDLRPQFVEQALSLRKKVLTNAKPKMIRGECLDGTMYVSMINSYLNSINNGGVPNIQNAWTYMCIQKCMKLQEQCYQFFAEQSQAFLRDNLPCSASEFEEEIQRIQDQCFKIFESEQIGEESKGYLQQLKGKLKEKINVMRMENERESINILKNYIIKNFSVIEKKMKMNQFQTFQEYLKSINNFYLYLVENGPDLPKREIVYLDFLKKVTTQGAEIFIKQINQSFQSQKSLSQEKQKLFKRENEELKCKVKLEAQKYKQKIDTIANEKQQIQRRQKQLTQRYEQLKASSRAEINKLESNFQNKLKIVEIKLGQTSLNLQDMKQKKQNLQTSYILQKKQRQKQKAILELKMNQLKDEVKALKIKQKNQQSYINDLNSQSNTKLKQFTIEYETKVNQLQNQLTYTKEMYAETLETKEDLQAKLKLLEKNAAVTNKKMQDELKAQIQRFQTYKNQIQNQKNEQIRNLQRNHQSLSHQLSQISALKQRYERQSKQLSERLKSATSQSEKQIAILTQKIEFLSHEAADNKEKLSKNFEHFEAMLISQSQMREEQLRKSYKSQLGSLQEQYQGRISQLENELSNVKEKCMQQTLALKKMEENHQFNLQKESKKLQNQIKNQANIIENLQEQRRKVYGDKQALLKEMQQRITAKEAYYQDKIIILEKELEIALERAFEQQSELSNKSEESLKQLKNYYELEKQNLEHRIANEKQKYQKKICKMRQQYETQIDEERKTTEQEYQNLKDQYNNELAMLKELVINLQHQNDSKSKSLQNIQLRYQELKQRLEKKQLEFSNKIQSVLKNSSQERQVLQQKIMEANEFKSKLQKEILVITHQKDQQAKELKDITAKHQAKNEEIFYLNKNMEKISNESRQKVTDLNNEYMNQRLNYQKKIALAEQQKQFYYKKIQDYEKEQIKNSLSLQELTKKLTSEHQDEIKLLQQKKNTQYSNLQSKYQKLKKSSKENEQQTTRTLNEVEKQLALQQQKYSNLLQKYQELQQKRSNDGNYLATELSHAKQQLTKVSKELNEEVNRLKKELNEVTNDKNQIQVLYERDKILLENKNNYLEDSKQKNKKEYLQKIRNLQQTIQNINKNRLNDKNYLQASHAESLAKVQKKYTTTIQEQHQNWVKRQRQYETSLKQLQFELRNTQEKTGNQIQMMTESIKTQERRIRQLQQSEKRALNQLQKYKAYKQNSSSQNLSLFERQRQNLKQKMQQKEQKYKNLQKAKQQIYYNFQKEKARWNLQKQNYLMRHDQLKDLISKQQKDLEKLNRENEKLKAEKKCNKLSGLSGFSRYSLERGNSKFSLEESINSISMSTSKQNCNPLGELSFFNNQ